MGGGVFVAILVIAILSFTSCRQIVFVPIEEPEEWTITIINNPEEVGTAETYSRYIRQRFVLPDSEPKENYSFDNYSLADGTELQAGDSIKYNGSDVIVTANWTYVVDVDNPGSNSIS